MTKIILGYRGQGKDFRTVYKLIYRICINTYGFAFIFLKRVAKQELIRDAYECVYEIIDSFLNSDDEL